MMDSLPRLRQHARFELTRHEDYVDLGGGILVLRQPITIGQFVEFVRAEHYFEAALWSGDARPARGGDEILRRIEYCADRANEPVLGVNWFEARAFCLYEAGSAGRVPYLDEWKQARALASRASSNRPWPWARSTPTEPLPAPVAEWCAEWYSPNAPHVCGPDVVIPTQSPAMRRVADAGRDARGADPSYAGGKIGFRVAIQSLGRA